VRGKGSQRNLSHCGNQNDTYLGRNTLIAGRLNKGGKGRERPNRRHFEGEKKKVKKCEACG